MEISIEKTRPITERQKRYTNLDVLLSDLVVAMNSNEGIRVEHKKTSRSLVTLSWSQDGETTEDVWQFIEVTCPACGNKQAEIVPEDMSGYAVCCEACDTDLLL